MKLMMTTSPLQQGQEHQLKDSDNSIGTRATTLLQIKGNKAVATRVMMPARQRQGLLRINNGNNAIVMTATIAIATIAETPAHQGQ
jgi:hypothetical protein